MTRFTEHSLAALAAIALCVTEHGATAHRSGFGYNHSGAFKRYDNARLTSAVATHTRQGPTPCAPLITIHCC